MVKFIFLLWITGLSCAQTIGIFTGGGGKPWDPDTVETGITGSEEAIIYLSRELADLGYQVIVLGDPPPGSRHSLPSANPRFLPFNPGDRPSFDIAISWRMPTIAEGLKRFANKVYFWPHDCCHELLSEQEILAFDDVLWLSKWQRSQWISLNPTFAKFTSVFGNGIDPDSFEPLEERENPYSCIYGSNYARGLEILLDIWPAVKGRFPRATLDIYYGWEHWGLLSQEKEAKLRAQVEALAPLDVREHGLVGHEELNRAYARASFWTYPCTDAETFCITALRAQFAGAIPVIIAGSALRETVRFGYKCYKPEQYFISLIEAMKTAEKISLERREKMREFILREFTWKEIALQWERVFDIPK